LIPIRKICRTERITLSFGLSIAVVSLIGFILNFTPWGLRLEPTLLSILIFVVCLGAITLFIWYKTIPNERFIISIDLSILNSDIKLDKILTIIVVISIILIITGLLMSLPIMVKAIKYRVIVKQSITKLIKSATLITDEFISNKLNLPLYEISEIFK